MWVLWQTLGFTTLLSTPWRSGHQNWGHREQKQPRVLISIVALQNVPRWLDIVVLSNESLSQTDEFGSAHTNVLVTFVHIMWTPWQSNHAVPFSTLASPRKCRILLYIMLTHECLLRICSTFVVIQYYDTLPGRNPTSIPVLSNNHLMAPNKSNISR